MQTEGTVKRYDCDFKGKWAPSKDGLFVLYSEHSALLEENKRLRVALRSLRKEHHLECEDGYYSCPKSPEGCFDEGAGDECTCGVDSANAIIDAALAPDTA